jgi:hypothetical protein
MLYAHGGPVKALGEVGRVGGYLVRFTTPGDPDVVGEFFTKGTHYDKQDGERLGVYYHHGFDGHMKTRKIGDAIVKFDDVGVWIEAQLNMADEYERALYEMGILTGKMGWSSGAVAHLYESEDIAGAFWIKTWVLAEASITPRPAEPRNRVLPLKTFFQQEAGTSPAAADGTEMAGNEINSKVDKLATQVSTLTETVATLAGTVAKAFAPPALPDVEPVYAPPGVPAIHNAETRRYDSTAAIDLVYVAKFLRGAQQHTGEPVPSALYKAIVQRFGSQEVTGSAALSAAERAFKALHPTLKANEISGQTMVGSGDEWVGVAYNDTMWEKARLDSAVLNYFLGRAIPFPAGAEALVFPLEGGDPVFYNTSEATSLSVEPGGVPVGKVPSSKIGTSSRTMTLKKLSARQLYTGELTETAILPFASELREQLQRAFVLAMSSAIIDGDTDLSATTNINHIAGTPTGNEVYTAFDGFRKNALVTNSTTNSRSGTTLNADDFSATLAMLGSAGIAGVPNGSNDVFFVIDLPTYWKAINLPEVKTRDVSTNATVESGILTRMFGVPVYPEAGMHFASSSTTNNRKANTAGKIDQGTASNNTTGSIVAVSGTQWRLGIRQALGFELQRWAGADTWELVTRVRAAFAYGQSTEASAITYNLSV